MNDSSEMNTAVDMAKIKSSNAKKDMDDFFKRYCQTNDSNIAVILKTHLYIENLLDEIITCLIPKSKKIINFRFSAKVDLIESFNICTDDIILRIREVNKIRNGFAHDLNKELVFADLKCFINGIKIRENISNTNKFKRGAMYLVGYLHGLKSVMNILPLSMYWASYKKIQEKTLDKNVIERVMIEKIETTHSA